MSICYIDTIDACQLRCPTCVRGTRLLPNTPRNMPVGMFERIVTKGKSEGYDAIGLYNWTEPFLNMKLPEYVSVVKRLGLDCELSTNLSFTNRFELIKKTLAAGVDRLIVSVSGYHQEVYEINHCGGNLAYVKDNLDYVRKLQSDGVVGPKVFLRFIQFDYNLSELPLLREYTHSIGVELEVIMGVGHPNHPVNTYASEYIYMDRLKNYIPEKPYEKDGEVCPLIMDTLSIDASGKAYVCCACPNYWFFQIGTYLEMAKDEILIKRYSHPICASCPFPRRNATNPDRDALVGALVSRLSKTGQDGSRKIGIGF